MLTYLFTILGYLAIPRELLTNPGKTSKILYHRASVADYDIFADMDRDSTYSINKIKLVKIRNAKTGLTPCLRL